VISNDYLIDALKVHPQVGGLASEELDDFTPAQENGKYLVLFDPLDGSSNIDINMCVYNFLNFTCKKCSHSIC
jgi:fructose-1,6-bisphosphatase I